MINQRFIRFTCYHSQHPLANSEDIYVNADHIAYVEKNTSSTIRLHLQSGQVFTVVLTLQEFLHMLGNEEG